MFLAWLNDDTIVLEEFDGNGVNLYSVQISSRQRQQLSPKSTGVAASRNGAIIFRKVVEGRHYVLRNGTETELHIGEHRPNNVFVANEETVAYNHGGNVIIYSLTSKDVKVVEPGYIVGVSAGGERVYYFTNYPHNSISP